MSLPEQPDYLSPCNGCGLCCLVEQCPISEALFGQAQVCPALQFHSDKFFCDLMIDPAAYGASLIQFESLSKFGLDPNKLSAEAYAAIIGRGIGCDSDKVTEYLPLVEP